MAHSADLVRQSIDALLGLFPDAEVDGRVDFDVLRELLGDAVDEREEKYGLNWSGKRQARRLALASSTGTLRPRVESSVDWESTRNLVIEGENLEVLKLLQKAYSGQVKSIYIDPPYNTGRDFVYPDDYSDSIANYLAMTGQVDAEGKAMSSNRESSGRFHTAWLNMMYPRLKLARNLLRSDGVIFISIDDAELENLRALCAEVFGKENFVAQIIWRKRNGPPQDRTIGATHDYIVCFAKDIQSVQLYLRPRNGDQLVNFKNPDNHPKGPWAAGDLMANVKGGRYVASLHYGIVNPNTGEEHFPGENGNWRFSAERMQELLANDEIYFGKDGRGKPKRKRFLSELKDGVTYPTIWDFVPFTQKGSEEMQQIFGASTIFENPKPSGLIQEILRLSTGPDDLVLDFFAGSGSTGHAVMQQNADDEGRRRFILVQLPEQTPDGSVARKAGFDTISELTIERLRRTGSETRESDTGNRSDVGFRVFRLDSSNLREWDPEVDDLAATLEESVEHVKAGRDEADLLFELLLKSGLDLTVAMVTKSIAGKTVHAVGSGVLLACLDESIAADEVETFCSGLIEWHHQLAPVGDVVCVFRDSAFADDVAKMNVTAMLEQAGLADVRSI
jgi:adenine-specific DNA-methyltransferase